MSELLEFDKNKFYKMIRKMVKLGIIAYIVCAPSGFIKKVYMLNPTIARKGKKYHEVIDIFPDFGS